MLVAWSFSSTLDEEKRREEREKREERENKGLALRFVKGDWCVLAREREEKPVKGSE